LGKFLRQGVSIRHDPEVNLQRPGEVPFSTLDLLVLVDPQGFGDRRKRHGPSDYLREPAAVLWSVTEQTH